MSFMRFISFLFFVAFCFTVNANENKYIFVGLKETNNAEQIAFGLMISEEDTIKCLLTSEQEEDYRKVKSIHPDLGVQLAHANLQLGNIEIIAIQGNAENFSKFYDINWQCPKCGFSNNPFRLHCKNCGAPRP